MSGLVGSTPSFSRSGSALGELLGRACPRAARPTAPASSRPGSPARPASRRARAAASACWGAMGPMLDSRADSKGVAYALPMRLGPERGRGRPRRSRRLTGPEPPSAETSRPHEADRRDAQARDGLRTRTRARERRRPPATQRDRGLPATAPRAPRRPRRRRRSRRRSASAARPDEPPKRSRPRLRKLRFAFVVLGLARARLRLLDLRDHDGRRPGPARAREPRAVQARRELDRLRRLRAEARDADQQPGPGLRRARRRSPR